VEIPVTYTGKISENTIVGTIKETVDGVSGHINLKLLPPSQNETESDEETTTRMYCRFLPTFNQKLHLQFRN
jgi:hypothetical protein